MELYPATRMSICLSCQPKVNKQECRLHLSLPSI
uniref:Uncharacterized protein n=1 Tax=Arundo donax TaxID=35708 RepID=A0A0A9GGV6_ARUDO